MSTSAAAPCTRVIDASRPPGWLPLWRIGRDAIEHVFATWRERARFERERRELGAVAELDPRMLRDIGAPDWLHDERQEARRAAAGPFESRRSPMWGC